MKSLRIFPAISQYAQKLKVSTLRGEVGMSEMRTRIINGRLQYIKSIEERENDLLKNILEEMREQGNYTWIKYTIKYLEELGLDFRNLLRNYDKVRSKKENQRS